MQQQNRQRVCKEHQEVIGNKMHFCFGKGFMMAGEVVWYRGGTLKISRRTSTTTYACISHTNFLKRCLKTL